MNKNRGTEVILTPISNSQHTQDLQAQNFLTKGQGA